LAAILDNEEARDRRRPFLFFSFYPKEWNGVIESPLPTYSPAFTQAPIGKSSRNLIRVTVFTCESFPFPFAIISAIRNPSPNPPNPKPTATDKNEFCDKRVIIVAVMVEMDLRYEYLTV
jgi:hypothetical protein